MGIPTHDSRSAADEDHRRARRHPRADLGGRAPVELDLGRGIRQEWQTASPGWTCRTRPASASSSSRSTSSVGAWNAAGDGLMEPDELRRLWDGAGGQGAGARRRRPARAARRGTIRWRSPAWRWRCSGFRSTAAAAGPADIRRASRRYADWLPALRRRVPRGGLRRRGGRQGRPGRRLHAGA